MPTPTAQESLGGLLETEVTIGTTRFFFAKLPAMAAYDVLEDLRYEFGQIPNLLSDLEVGELGTKSQREQVVVRALMHAFTGLRPQFVKQIRDKLFQVVSFSNAQAQTPQVVRGAEDTAFNGLESSAVYDVLLRSLAVNFTDSLRDLQSKFADSALATSP